MTQHYTLIIVGGGPIGIACGLAAKKAGLDYLILEKGCLTNSLFNYPLNMTFFSTSERLEIGGIPFVSNNVKPTRPEALEYYRRVTLSNHLHIHLQEGVKDITRTGDQYTVHTSHASYTASHIIIATGFYDIPIRLNVPGEELPKVVHYYKEGHFYALQKVIVVGASNSAVDAALETWRKGAEVTMVVRKEKIGDRVKYWVKPDMENRIKEGSIKAYFNATLKAIREQEVDIDTPDGVVTIANDYVIALTGYQPNFDFLRRVGIQLSDDALLQPTYNPDTMESNLPNVYLAGVVCGGMNTHVWFIENSREHAEKIVQAIVEKKEVH
ncbi:YpdA family putative bacillithiol disulfide reductase [Pseudoflavitalea sp. X16]|uniref:YpdA family putative bacillithiol disulfide reductase n=1 Tax=Paraflavitalea devenefica TaxID=2716334 RepID=UPI00141E38E3|nr:YpdA family putative bacillithiol disulfide reductase [Paraflavitalea devenefica]NII25535.1 YpdA family putative bacillithiol disulfide reductase [Paraflavitalea devenefica]